MLIPSIGSITGRLFDLLRMLVCFTYHRKAPEFITDLKNQFGEAALTVQTGIVAEIDFKSSKITAGEKIYDMGKVGAAAQELILVGGLENWVKQAL